MIVIDFKKNYKPGPRSFTYVVMGDPIPLARARHGNGKVWDAQKHKKFLVASLLDAQHNDGPLFSGPLHLDIIFFLPMAASRPKLFDSRRHAFHIAKPDLSNLVKFIEDVATGILYRDDSCISSFNCQKRYDDKPRTELTITEMKLE